jgi:hypothetical protein
MRRGMAHPVGPDWSETLHAKMTCTSSLSMTLDEPTNLGVPTKEDLFNMARYKSN